MAKVDNISQYVCYQRSDIGFTVMQASGVCEACGGFGPYTYAPIINDKLAAEWHLNKEERVAFSARESMYCQFCGCSYRLRALAKAIVLNVSPAEQKSLAELIDKGSFDNMRVAEINSCGVLHEILKKIPKIAYSEYGSRNPNVRSEDLSALSYKNNTFDLVLTSDTLEHVPDPKKALLETARILRPTGTHIFTIPLRLDKSTIPRTKEKNGETTYVRPASFHGSGESDYLVWNEFGVDFIKIISTVYPFTKLYFANLHNLKDPCAVIVARKNKTHSRHRLTDASTPYSGERQIERVASLVEKMKLTQNHANNLESIVNDRHQYIDGLHKQLAQLQKQLHTSQLEIERLQRSPVRALRKTYHRLKKPKK